MTYLSRLTLNSHRREVRRDLADCQALHCRLLSAFGSAGADHGAREEFGLLYRLDRSGAWPAVLVQSAIQPDWGRLPAGYLVAPPAWKPVDDLFAALEHGTELAFRLRANPTKRVWREERGGKRWDGKRVNIVREEDQLAWLERKAVDGGFCLRSTQIADDVPDVRTAPEDRIRGERPGTRRLTFGSVLFDGRLRVTDADRFRETLRQGIGSAKAYGFGLLSVAPVRSRP